MGMRTDRDYLIDPEKLDKKYIDFLDEIWDKVDSWSGCVWALREKFGITASYADAVIDAYLEV